MPYLLAVTFLWAFSFSLIGVYLTNVDPWFSVLIRTFLAMLVFLPMLKGLDWRRPLSRKLMLIGAIQLGLMYGFYYHAFWYLTVPEVLLFTIFTPLYVTLFNDFLNKQFNKAFFVSALLAVLGALTIRYNQITSNFLLGFVLVQSANICFAIGQVSYKRLMRKHKNLAANTVFAYFFIGAFALAAISYLLFGNLQKLPTTNLEWGVLFYLGIVASGLGYYGWNHGATKVNVGTLAAMNNLLIPAGIIVNVSIWNRDAELVPLLTGAIIILAALLWAKKTSGKL